MKRVFKKKKNAGDILNKSHKSKISGILLVFRVSGSKSIIIMAQGNP